MKYPPTKTNNVPIGCKLADEAPVDALDEMCLIIHSSAFEKGLLFDYQFEFHFYRADLCMQAFNLGFNVLATQVMFQHKSRTLLGAGLRKAVFHPYCSIGSLDYLFIVCDHYECLTTLFVHSIYQIRKILRVCAVKVSSWFIRSLIETVFKHGKLKKLRNVKGKNYGKN